MLDLIVSGTGAVLALVIGALWLSRRPGSRAARRFLLVAAAAYFLASIYAVPYLVGSVLLTRGFHQFAASDIPAGPTAIVLLGGGAETARGWDGAKLGVVSGDGLVRVLEAARVYRLTDARWIVSSGGLLTSPEREEPNAVVMRDALVHVGVPPARVVLEPGSLNTHDQAVRVASLLQSLGAEHVVLVTSGIHMRRALGTFRRVNISAVPAIAPEVHEKDPWREWLIPSTKGLALSGQVAHELVGITYYAVRGWWRF